MPDPPRVADLKARIIADIKREGQSLIGYTELREAWPKQFASTVQFNMISKIAEEEGWTFEFVATGVRFTPMTD